MKNNITLLSILAMMHLAFGSCNKDEEVRKSYSAVGFDDIKAEEALFTDGKIDATDASGILLGSGTIFIFKTNEGRYGKMEIVNFDESSNYDLRINAVVYKDDKSILGSADNLLIRGTWLADLDVPREALFNDFKAKGDFQLVRLNDTDSNILPWNGAKFYKY